jgi:hypothetical protein
MSLNGKERGFQRAVNDMVLVASSATGEERQGSIIIAVFGIRRASFLHP